MQYIRPAWSHGLSSYAGPFAGRRAILVPQFSGKNKKNAVNSASHPTGQRSHHGATPNAASSDLPEEKTQATESVGVPSNDLDVSILAVSLASLDLGKEPEAIVPGSDELQEVKESDLQGSEGWLDEQKKQRLLFYGKVVEPIGDFLEEGINQAKAFSRGIVGFAKGTVEFLRRTAANTTASALKVTAKEIEKLANTIKPPTE